jgi:nucleotide-binding universal stress UspA family protein
MFDIKLDKVLVPVDFSDPSRHAFYYGLKLASTFGADFHVLHVTESFSTFEANYDTIEKVSGEVERLEKGVRRRLDTLFEEGDVAESDRRRVKVEIRGGKPWLEIVRYAHQSDIDLIVMATLGRSGIKQMLIGSTAERVVRRASCPVLCVKPQDFEPDIDKLTGEFLPTS